MTSNRATRPRGLCILVVDDHADAVRALALILRAEGHAVTTALTLAEAVAASARMPALDVLVSDINLPDGNGCQLLRLLRAPPGGGPRFAVALTGYDERTVREQCEGAGFDLFLLKPLAIERLLAAIANAPAAGRSLGRVPAPAGPVYA